MPTAWACKGLAFQQAFVREPPPSANVAAAYGMFVNHSSKTLVINQFSSTAFGGVELHEMRMRGDTMQMRALPQLTIKPHQTVKLERGGLHLMLFRPQKAITASDTVSVTASCGKSVTSFIVPVQRL